MRGMEGKAHAENVSGRFYVNKNCLNHGLCKVLAPQNFTQSSDQTHIYVSKQPETSEELAAVIDAASQCPVNAIIDTEAFSVAGDVSTTSSDMKRHLIRLLLLALVVVVWLLASS